MRKNNGGLLQSYSEDEAPQRVKYGEAESIARRDGTGGQYSPTGETDSDGVVSPFASAM